MKTIIIIPIILFIVFVSISTIVNREVPKLDRNDPEATPLATPGLGSRDAELIVAAYVKAATDNNERVLLGYIADLATLPQRQRRKDSQKNLKSNKEITRVGLNMNDVDAVGHDLLAKDEPELIWGLNLRISKIESKCTTAGNCRVRVFFEKFENREIVHDFIVCQVNGKDWKIVSVLSALITS